MKATETPLLPFLEGKKQFRIPIYQRTYSWTRKQCLQLWNDIMRAGEDDTVAGHFVGSIVYIQQGLYQGSGVPELLVIDGQQRLTTLTLLLTALADSAASSQDGAPPFSSEEIKEVYLLNKHAKDDQHHKLLLTQSDRDTLLGLVKGAELPLSASPRIVDNYRFFQEQIHADGVDPGRVYRGIGKLIIVDISLDRNHDNPQLIFESLNSTGLDLSQADLIRNYVLMGLEPDEQEEIYNDYWFRMEQSFGFENYADHFDRFMRNYLTTKSRSRSIPKIDHVYEAFKGYLHNAQDRSVEDIVAEVYKYSKYFVRLAFSREEDPDLRQAFRDINVLRVDVAYPLLLELYDDYAEWRLSKDDFVAILRLVESYVFRRMICGIPTNTLNTTFATFSREIDKDNYLESVKAAFLLKDSYRRFPKDAEFWYQFTVKDVYNFRVRNHLLDKLENQDRKERVDVGSYTIEHIMPQNEDLSADWRQDLGEEWQRIHAEYLHTIGNLTLTGYNSELSDRPFKEKRDMKGGFKDSPIRLNHHLANLDHWNEEQINQRAIALADMAVEIWAAPTLPAEVLNGHKAQTAGETKKGSAPSLDEICAKADEEGTGEGFRRILHVAQRHGMYARPNVKSVMYTPDTNRNRMLFTVWLKSEQPKKGSMAVSPETFAAYYPVDADAVASVIGPSEWLDVYEDVEGFVSGLESLFEDIEADPPE